MKSILIFASLLVSSVSHGYQEGTFDCAVDSATNSKVKVTTVSLASGLNLPYVQIEFYKSGANHAFAGIATVNIKKSTPRDKVNGVETFQAIESLFIPGYASSAIEFGTAGEVADRCTKN